MRLDDLAHFVGWAAFAALGVVSLWPGEIEAHTGVSGHLEHFAAYAFTGFLLSLAYTSLDARLAIFCLLAMYAAALERFQMAVPGRTSQMFDWEGSVAGAFAGLLGALLFEAISSRARR